MTARPTKYSVAVFAFASLLAAIPASAGAQDQPPPGAAVASADAASGQSPSPAATVAPGEGMSQEIVKIRHADPEDLRRVLRIFHVDAQAHPNLGILTLQGPRDQVAAAAAAARELDVAPSPTPNLQVTVFVLGVSKTHALDGSVPQGLAEVAHQLRDVFGFKGVDLIDSVSVRVLDRGRGGVEGILAAADGVPALPYVFGFNRASLVERQDGPPSIRLAGFRFTAANQQQVANLPPKLRDATPSPGDFHTELSTDVEVRAGQTAVLGHAATAGSRDGLVLVVRAGVVE
jgi:hypothetical protein